MSKYLLTGAAGFIAANVARQLLAAGHEVVGIDNLNDAYNPRLKQWRLEQLQKCSGFLFYSLDICDRDALEQLFEQRRHDPFAAVINLAARAGVRPSVENPWVYFQTNADGTLNLLDLCRRHGVKKFVLASTSSLYGANNNIPFHEDDDASRPLSPYAASKKAAEAIAYTYHHLHQLDVSVLRYFTVYGPAGRPDMSIFRFVHRISEGLPITVFGDGTQERDFTYVEDVARGTIAAVQPADFEVINLGGDKPVKLNDIIAELARLVGLEPQIVRRPSHPADVPATWASIEKARSILGWSPTVPWQEGLRCCVDWYRENRELAQTVADGGE